MRTIATCCHPLATSATHPRDHRRRFPSPRASHTATLSADGWRVVIFGGVNEGSVLSDVHVLDTRHSIWWQVYPSGSPPTPRHSHAAALVGTDIVLFGGIPAETFRSPTYVLHTRAWEVRTSARLEPLFEVDPDLNATCSLYLGSLGSPSQVWSCGPRLRERLDNGTAADTGADYVDL